jgi:hypothetical protein
MPFLVVDIYRRKELLESQHVQVRDSHESVLKHKTAAQPNEEISMLPTLANRAKSNCYIRIPVHVS